MIQSCKIIAIFVLTLLAFAIQAQPTVVLSIDKDSTTIGDIIQLKAIVRHPKSSSVLNAGLEELPKSDTWEMLGGVILSKDDTIDTKGKFQLVTKETFDALVFLDEGLLEFPPVTYQIKHQDTTYSIQSNPVSIVVKPVIKQTDLPAGLKTIIKEPITFWDYLPWIIGFVVLGLGIWLFFFLRNRTPKEKPIPFKRPPTLPPNERVTNALNKLLKEERWLNEPKLNQVKLSQIIRWYLEQEFKIPALENTTGEIDRTLRKHLSPNQRNVLVKLLNDSDLVKFAKLTMPDEQQEQSILEAIKWVKNNTFQ